MNIDYIDIFGLKIANSDCTPQNIEAAIDTAIYMGFDSACSFGGLVFAESSIDWKEISDQFEAWANNTHSQTTALLVDFVRRRYDTDYGDKKPVNNRIDPEIKPAMSDEAESTITSEHQKAVDECLKFGLEISANDPELHEISSALLQAFDQGFQSSCEILKIHKALK